ncbi:MAG: pilin, partial [Nitrosomonadales bacterium]|nr:pilin [Nitrosomonadales bacterium]
VTGTTFTSTAGVSCKIEVTYGNGSSKVNGKISNLTYTIATGGWACSTDLPAGIKPTAC